MGAIDKFINAMKINTDVVDDYDYYEEDEMDFANEAQESRSLFREKDTEEKSKKSSKVSSFAVGKKKASSNYGMEIKSYRPKTIEDATIITDELLDGNSVIINVSGVDVTHARQILDFTSGSIYALKGTFKKITDSIFVAVPAGINIEGVFEDKPEEE